MTQHYITLHYITLHYITYISFKVIINLSKDKYINGLERIPKEG